MSEMTERMAQMKDLNPFGIEEGAESYSILIDCNTSTYDGKKLDWIGRVAVPVEVNGEELELEEAATLAYRVAQQEGLPAQLMSICSFYFWEEDAEGGGWVQFL